MSTAIFTHQQQNIDSELAALQRQIEQLQQQKQNLSYAENLADTGINYLREVLDLAPNVAGDLKTAILSLFKGDSGSDDEGNDEPQSPAPKNDGDYLSTDEYPSNGKNGSNDFMQWVQVREDLGYFQREDEAINTVYVASANKNRLKSWCKTIQELIPGCSFELRHGTRLEKKWEAKFWGLGLNDVDFLSECNFSQNQRDYFADSANEPELNGQYTELSCEINPQPTQQPSNFHIDDVVYVPSLDKRGRVDAIAITGKLLLVEPDGALAGGHLGSYAPDEVEEIDNEPAVEQPWKTGNECEIISERHPELTGKVGKITAVSSVGAAVSVDGGAAQFYRFDEIQHPKQPAVV